MNLSARDRAVEIVATGFPGKDQIWLYIGENTSVSAIAMYNRQLIL
jgi:hypothetical protein